MDMNNKIISILEQHKDDLITYLQSQESLEEINTMLSLLYQQYNKRCGGTGLCYICYRYNLEHLRNILRKIGCIAKIPVNGYFYPVTDGPEQWWEKRIELMEYLKSFW